MAAHGVRINQQGIGGIPHPPTRAEQDYRIEAISLTHIADTLVGRTQFAEFQGGQLVILHVEQFTKPTRKLPR